MIKLAMLSTFHSRFHDQRKRTLNKDLGFKKDGIITEYYYFTGKNVFNSNNEKIIFSANLFSPFIVVYN